jgi:hypothetical protein
MDYGSNKNFPIKSPSNLGTKTTVAKFKIINKPEKLHNTKHEILLQYGAQNAAISQETAGLFSSCIFRKSNTSLKTKHWTL